MKSIKFNYNFKNLTKKDFKFLEYFVQKHNLYEGKHNIIKIAYLISEYKRFKNVKF
jgi:hypothetical protein